MSKIVTLTSRYRYMLVIAMLMLINAVAFAQEPVTLEVPVDEIFAQANTWLGVFAPIIAIGVGISIAIALLTFIGKQIVSAFRG